MTSAKDLRAGNAPDLEIVGGNVTLHPSGFIESERRAAQENTERNLVEHMARFRENPFDFLREVSLFVSGTGWRSYDDVIGQPVFYSGFSEKMKASVMSVPMLQDKIRELAEQRLLVEEKEGLLNRSRRDYAVKRAIRQKEIAESLQEVAESMTDQMICKMESKGFIRGAYYLCTQLLTRAYHQGRCVRCGQLEGNLMLLH